MRNAKWKLSKIGNEKSNKKCHGVQLQVQWELAPICGKLKLLFWPAENQLWDAGQVTFRGHEEMVMMRTMLTLVMMMRWQESKSEAKDFPNLVRFCWDKWDGLGLVRKKRGPKKGKVFRIGHWYISNGKARWYFIFCLLFVIYGVGDDKWGKDDRLFPPINVTPSYLSKANHHDSTLTSCCVKGCWKIEAAFWINCKRQHSFV